MNNESGNKKAEQIKTPENNQENEFSIDNINDILKEKTDVFDNLNKFSKDNIFKSYDFHGNLEMKDKAEDNYDSDVYAKASLGKKFASFIMPKKFLGVVKTKDRGLVDKNTIEDYVEGRIFRLGDKDKDVYKHEEEKVAKKFNLTEEDSKGRVVTKTYEFTNGKIEKIIKSSRTEEGMIDFAGKTREDMISTIDRKFGNDLVGLKESVVKNKQTKENMLKINGFMPEEEKQALADKLDREGANKEERIKEKEEKIAEELKTFKEPLESRLKETSEMENSLSKALNFIKTNESNLNKNIKECEAFIKETQKLSLSDEVRDDIVKTAEAQRVVLSAQVKEFADKKALVSYKMGIIKNNKKEIEATLDRMNNIGKTKDEIAKEKKSKTKDGAGTEPVGKKAKSETVDGAKKEDDDNKSDINELLESFGDFSGKNKEDQDETEEDSEDDKDEENKEVLTHKEIAEIVDKELKSLGIMKIKERTAREKITSNVILVVEALIAESKEPFGKKEIKKEIGTWYRKYSKNYFKKSKQSKIDLIKDKEEIEGEIDDEEKKEVFSDEEIEDIVKKELKVVGFMNNKEIVEKSKGGLIKHLIGAVKNEIIKSEEEITEDFIKNEVDDWYKKLTKNSSKSVK